MTQACRAEARGNATAFTLRTAARQPASAAASEGWTGAGASTKKPVLRQYAQVAQSVEQRIENPRVGGSIPPLATIQNLSIPKTWVTFHTGDMGKAVSRDRRNTLS